MKFLYFTDTHIRGSNPRNRKDVFIETMEQKFQEIAEIIDKRDIDFVIHGGDLFDRPDSSISVVSRFAHILKTITKPIYIVSGNHDIFGHNPDTLDRTMLGLLRSFDFLNVVDKDSPILVTKDDMTVQLTGVPYSYDIDLSPDNYILKEVDKRASYAINIVHGMLLDKPFIKGIPYTLIDDVIETKANITLCGHYHAGFDTVIRDGKYFINPGSLVRVTNSIREMERRPKVVMLDLSEEIQVEDIYLKSAKPGEEVLDRTVLENGVFRSERIYEFKQTIDAALDFEKIDINDLITEVALTEKVPKSVREEALRRIAAVQMKNI
ncbi:MAG: metallophosphoesterase family protein [Gudongella sp.]|jgi:DNA repair exonuclease SbcCD nuclease subunit|nr:metallophosphoesterase family protein [Gudongella sp.]